MPFVTEGSATYWLPEVFPENSSSWNDAQALKQYLTPDGSERLHPKWTFASNGAYVNDEYLLRNEGWKVVVDNKPEDQALKHTVRDSYTEWDDVDEGTVSVTYSFVDFTDDETTTWTANKWQMLRDKRDDLLAATDWAVVRAQEQGLTLSTALTTYRQNLRDFPSTVTNIVTFDLGGSDWPTVPTNFFA